MPDVQSKKLEVIRSGSSFFV